MVPLQIIPYALHLLNVAASLYSMYSIIARQTLSRYVKAWMIVVQLWNILLQTTFFVHYTFNINNWNIRQRSYSMVWITETGMVFMITFVNFGILRLFQSIIPFATKRNLWIMRIVVSLLYVGTMVIPVAKVTTGIWTNLWEIEQLSSMSFILICMVMITSKHSIAPQQATKSESR